MPNSPSLESTEDEELGRITKEAKAAVLQEKLSKEKKSKIVEKLEKTKEKLSLKKGATKEPPKLQQSNTNHQNNQQPKSIPAPKIQKSKHEPPRPSAEPSKPLQTPPIQTPPTLVLPKPRRNLKFRCREKTPMYGKDSDRTPSKSNNNNNKNESRTPKRTISADKSHFPDHYFETPLQPSSTLS
uniref:Uncharacterized protein n=1 Tax=Panagrolaimus davidi TaxID=227884 RepID=A0A914PCA7_9BILA